MSNSNDLNIKISKWLGWKFGSRDECCPSWPDDWVGPCWWIDNAPYGEKEVAAMWESQDFTAKIREKLREIYPWLQVWYGPAEIRFALDRGSHIPLRYFNFNTTDEREAWVGAALRVIDAN